MSIETISLGESKKSGIVAVSSCYYSHFIDEEKTYLVVGPKVSDDQLSKVSKSFG